MPPRPKFTKTARTDKEGRVIYSRIGAKSDYVRRKDPSTGAMVFRKVAQKKKTFRGGFSCKYTTTAHNSKQCVYGFLNQQNLIEADATEEVRKYNETLNNISILIEKLQKLVPADKIENCDTDEPEQVEPVADGFAEEIEEALTRFRDSTTRSGLGTGNTSVRPPFVPFSQRFDAAMQRHNNP